MEGQKFGLFGGRVGVVKRLSLSGKTNTYGIYRCGVLKEKLLCIYSIIHNTQAKKNMEMKPEESMKKTVPRRKRAVVSFVYLLFIVLLFSWRCFMYRDNRFYQQRKKTF
jgi:hypothetical protein